MPLKQTRARPKLRSERRKYWVEQTLKLAIRDPAYYRQLIGSKGPVFWMDEAIESKKIFALIGNPAGYSLSYMCKQIRNYARKLSKNPEYQGDDHGSAGQRSNGFAR